MPVRRQGFSFSKATGRYRNLRTGRFLSSTEIRRVQEIAIQKSAARVQELAGQLRSGSISVDDWSRAMRAELKYSHVAAASLAKGGREQMSQADFGRAGYRLR